MGLGFSILGTILWNVLDRCKESNDIHSAKVIMMLSQVSEILIGRCLGRRTGRRTGRGTGRGRCLGRRTGRGRGRMDVTIY